MKIPTRLIAFTLIAAFALPAYGFAAKPEKPGKPERRKKDKTAAAAPAVSFTQADKDADGSVSSAEYVAAMKEQLGESAASLRFGTLDKDSDGKLSKEEFDTTSTAPEKKKRKKKDKS